MHLRLHKLYNWLFLLLFVSACTSIEEENAALQEAIKPVREKFAPDRRVAVFDINWARRASELVLKGEVDNLAAKDECVAAIRSATTKDVVDSILVLPDPALGERRFGIVNVSVGNVRGKPSQSSELVTQVLMGSELRLLKSKGGWYYVQSPDRYLGWLENESVEVMDEDGVSAWSNAAKIIVTDHFGIIRHSPNKRAFSISDAVVGVVVKRTGFWGKWVGVECPDGRMGYIDRSMTQDYDRWRGSRELTGDNVEQAAKMFLGVPYLWGGTSAKGFDCSGFTKTAFRLNGIELGRDANQQAMMGEEVGVGEKFENVKKGDLLFFGRKATDERPERIVHVGIYLGGKEFIHASPAAVRIGSLDPSSEKFDEFNLNRFVRARRIIPAM